VAGILDFLAEERAVSALAGIAAPRYGCRVHGGVSA